MKVAVGCVSKRVAWQVGGKAMKKSVTLQLTAMKRIGILAGLGIRKRRVAGRSLLSSKKLILPRPRRQPEPRKGEPLLGLSPKANQSISFLAIARTSSLALAAVSLLSFTYLERSRIPEETLTQAWMCDRATLWSNHKLLCILYCLSARA